MLIIIYDRYTILEFNHLHMKIAGIVLKKNKQMVFVSFLLAKMCCTD